MKKVISVLTAAAVVLGCLSGSILWTAAEGESFRSGFYYDFSNSDSYATLADVSSGGTKTYLTKPMYIPGAAQGNFDADRQAAKIYSNINDANRRNTFLWLGCALDEYTADMASHTVLAMKVKLSNPATAKLGSVKMMVRGTTMDKLGLSERGTEMALSTVPIYKNTTDWQLVLIDLSPDNYNSQLRQIANTAATVGTTAGWFMTMIELSSYGDTNPIYVQWAGVFENEEQALANYKATTDKVDLTPDFLMDFSTEASYNNMLDGGQAGNMENPRSFVNTFPGTENGSTLSYNSTESAMQIQRGADGVILDLRCLDWRVRQNIEQVQTFAFKVKLAHPLNARLKLQSAGVLANNGAATDTAGTVHTLNSVPAYDVTSDWQLVCIDLSKSNWPQTLKALSDTNAAAGTTSVWWGIQLKLAMNHWYDEAVAVYVQWGGFFPNEATAKAYYLNENRSLPDSGIENLGAQVREHDKALRFGFRIEAGNVSYAMGSYEQAKNANYYMRNDLIQSKATMVIGGAERRLVDFGAIVTVKDNTKADNLTMENAKTAGNGINAISGRKLYYAVGNRVEYVVTITNANKYADKPIYARVYVAYIDADGSTRYAYGDMISRVVNNLLENPGDFTVTPAMTIQQSAAAVTNKNATYWSPLDVAYTAISSYDPDWQYVHHPGLAVFKGKLYASFSRGRAYEDTPGQHVVIRSVDTDKVTTPSAWSPLTTVATSQFGTTHGFCINGLLYATEDVLFCYYMDKALSETWVTAHAGQTDAEKYAHNRTADDYYNNVGKSRGMMIYTTDGVHWSEPQNVGFAANESPRQSLTGQWFAGSGNQLLYSDAKTPLGTAWTNIGRYVGMTKAQIAALDNDDGKGESRGKLTEASWYQTDDRILHHMLRSDTGVVWMSESYDNGKNWTVPYPTNFTSDTTMAKFGRLSNTAGSKYYFIGSPDRNGKRDPLALYTSKDGYNFDTKYIIRQSGSYTMQSSNWTKIGACAYPEALIHDGYMYVIHSEYKEIMSVSRIAMADIQ
ncbi:MAG: exo-alpha-sialidase [Clostridia bacterium]|nr:exo-alpha-sialidase [Clostridia bacterium]